MADANSILPLLLYGAQTHKWSCFGQDVEYDLFTVGTEEVIQRTVSGLDQQSREYIENVYDVAHSLKSIGGYQFEDKLDEKLKFIRGMRSPMFRLFVAELRTAELKAEESFRKAIDDLKV